MGSRDGSCNGPTAQSEERRNRIAEVVGSNPIRSTNSLSWTNLTFIFGERLFGHWMARERQQDYEE